MTTLLFHPQFIKLDLSQNNPLFYFRHMRLLICLDIFLVSAVDRNNFKKCSDSSFCARRRKFTGLENEPYKIAAHELNVENSILNLTLEAQGRPTLIALHTILSGGSARIVIEENNPYKVKNTKNCFIQKFFINRTYEIKKLFFKCYRPLQPKQIFSSQFYIFEILNLNFRSR